MPQEYVTFNDFMSLPVLYYRSIGVDPFESISTKATSHRWLYANFLFQVLNLIFVIVLEAIFVYISFMKSENFVESCMVMGYIGYGLVGELKMITVWLQKPKLTALVREMESIFPSSAPEDQRKYHVEHYLQRCRMFTKGFTGFYLVLVALYNLFIVVQFIVQRFITQLPGAQMSMPYSQISPWSVDNSLGFCVMYALQALAGYTSTAGHISSDILIYAVVIQDVMHYDFLSKELVKLDIHTDRVADGYAKDLKLLQNLISYHNKLLGLSDVINKVFGFPLLLNVLASSLIVCFVGFQMTLGLSTEQVCKLAVMLVAQILEIYLICYFSDMLIIASGSLAASVYQMNWIEADTRYKKMLILIALRAQRPVCLKATVFLDVSMQTMTMFLEMTYRFFCIIRTMYQ
ncbi:odorant receptor 67a-like [Drosophila grimshawi]|uniref:Odorant receptor n=1 Tax=Drosophila grimshawi TaxID=7222 RepID=B4JCI3_DROGR|nr:odorant receptor 67a-like [Drosophila grimshawi]EDW03137.1 GH11074 [Drosophila grimshawi]